MTKRKLEKIRKQYEKLDYSRWHILGYDELLKINGGSSASSDDDDSNEEADGFSAEDESSKTNDAETASESGGHEIENTVEAVANAEVGDTLTRDDGTQVTITQEDIDWAQEHCDSGKNKDDEDESPENKSGEEVPEAMPPEEEESSSGSNSADEKDAGDSSRNAETEEEASTSQSQKQSDEEKESSASTENKTLDDDKTDSKETASSSKAENSVAENENKQSPASSGKENSSAPTETTRSAESAPPSASHHNEKSEHGFWDSVMGKVSDAFSAAKDWVCSSIGLGETSVVNKTSGSIIVKPEKSDKPYSILKTGDTYKGKIDGIIFPDGTVKKTSGKSNYVATVDGKNNYKVSGGNLLDTLGNILKCERNSLRIELEREGVDADGIGLRWEDMYGTYQYGSNQGTFLESWLNTEKKVDVNNDGFTDLDFTPIPRNSDGGIPSKDETLGRWNELSGM